MKSKLTTLFIFSLMFFCFNSVTSAQDAPAMTQQDTIYTKAKEKLIGKVIEIGINEIKYKDGTNPDGPMIVLRKSDVMKIKYPNGTETVFLKDPYEVNQEMAIRNKSNAIKFEFLSPVRHNL